MLKKILIEINRGCSLPHEIAQNIGVEESALPGLINTLMIRGYLMPIECSECSGSCSGCPSKNLQENKGTTLYITEKGKHLIESYKNEK